MKVTPHGLRTNWRNSSVIAKHNSADRQHYRFMISTLTMFSKTEEQYFLNPRFFPWSSMFVILTCLHSSQELILPLPAFSYVQFSEKIHHKTRASSPACSHNSRLSGVLPLIFFFHFSRKVGKLAFTLTKSYAITIVKDLLHYLGLCKTYIFVLDLQIMSTYQILAIIFKSIFIL